MRKVNIIIPRKINGSWRRNQSESDKVSRIGAAQIPRNSTEVSPDIEMSPCDNASDAMKNQR